MWPAQFYWLLIRHVATVWSQSVVATIRRPYFSSVALINNTHCNYLILGPGHTNKPSSWRASKAKDVADQVHYSIWASIGLDQIKISSCRLFLSLELISYLLLCVCSSSQPSRPHWCQHWPKSAVGANICKLVACKSVFYTRLSSKINTNAPIVGRHCNEN